MFTSCVWSHIVCGHVHILYVVVIVARARSVLVAVLVVVLKLMILDRLEVIDTVGINCKR